MEATVLSTREFTYHPSKHPEETRTAIEMWFTFSGVPYSFKMSFFTEEAIAKVKAAEKAKKAVFSIKPDRYVNPIFVLE